MKKIAYLTGTRAEFGLMKTILKAIVNSPNWRLQLLVTGMHLMDEFGNTVNEVKKEFKIDQTVDAVFEQDDRISMARFTAKCAQGVTEALIKLKPDTVMVLGDRGEQLAMAIAAAYLNIPIIHLSGGDLTTTIDDKTRHAISMLADWHLPTNKDSAKRLSAMGINSQKIKIVGASGLDEIRNLTKTDKKDLIVVLQHPDEQENQAADQITATLEAVITFGLPVRIIYPNADAGGRAQIKVIQEFRHKYPRLISVSKSLEHEAYLKLLQQAKVLVGNSSSGIVEASALLLPVVNVGPRQQGRLRAGNVVETGYNQKEIIKAIKSALAKKIDANNMPYGNGHAAEKVIQFLNQEFSR